MWVTKINIKIYHVYSVQMYILDDPKIMKPKTKVLTIRKFLYFKQLCFVL